MAKQPSGETNCRQNIWDCLLTWNSSSFFRSDSLEGDQVVEIKDDSGRVIWSKVKHLTEEEIVETVLDSARQPRWTIHRPIKGWYLVLRSPSLPPTSFISLRPSTNHSADNFLFTIRSVLTFPTTAGAPVPPPSPSTRIDFKPEELEEKAKEEGAATKSHFRLQPSVPAHTHRQSSAAWSLSKFTGLFVDRGKTFSCVWEDENGSEVLRFEDAPSLLSLSTKGSLYLNENLVNITGMEPSFWIAIALAYLEFLQDKDAYSAASHD
ncbi:hypothetical protein RQP46_005077 [Phenoliferia psychrophenolica]